MAGRKAFYVALPPIQEQRAIAHILGTLDDKIELSRRMNETLEAMARALFKSWFVDFDPVRAKVADLISSRVLEIGDGYRAKNSELGQKGLPFIRAGNLKNGFDTAGAEILCQESVAKAGGKVSHVGDVSFTSKGTIGRFARVTEHTAPRLSKPRCHRSTPTWLICVGPWSKLGSSRMRARCFGLPKTIHSTRRPPRQGCCSAARPTGESSGRM